jgi:hypothetical protein
LKHQNADVIFRVFAVVNMKNAVCLDVGPVGTTKTDVSEERVASICVVERNSEIGTALAVISRLLVAR